MTKYDLQREARNITQFLKNHKVKYDHLPRVLFIDVPGTHLTFTIGPDIIEELDKDPYYTLLSFFHDLL